MLYFDRTGVSGGIDVNKTSVIFATIGISYILVFSFSQISAIDVMIY